MDMEFTRITNTLAPELAKTHVILWDVGPPKPVAPTKPVTPKGKDGDPDYDIAMVDFREALEAYSTAVKAHTFAKIEYAEWLKVHGERGAIERFFYSCDADDALQYDPKRYHISASTRGHSGLANHGLPEGFKPGKGQESQINRMRQGEAEFARAKAADPIFGNPELRP